MKKVIRVNEDWNAVQAKREKIIDMCFRVSNDDAPHGS